MHTIIAHSIDIADIAMTKCWLNPGCLPDTSLPLYQRTRNEILKK